MASIYVLRKAAAREVQFYRKAARNEIKKARQYIDGVPSLSESYMRDQHMRLHAIFNA